MGIFNRKEKTIEENPPEGLDVRHSFSRPLPGRYPTIGAHYGGNDGWAASSDAVKSDGADPDTVSRRPDPDHSQHGANNDFARWNSDTLGRAAAAEKWSVTDEGGRAISKENAEELNPNIKPPKPDRWTAYLNPAPFRFLAYPLGIMRSQRNLNGTHFSMASNRRAYPIGGMQSARRFRNTYRVEPTSRDATDSPEENVYVAPTPSQVIGKVFRL